VRRAGAPALKEPFHAVVYRHLKRLVDGVLKAREIQHKLLAFSGMKAQYS
jgi:hypothetical protein